MKTITASDNQGDSKKNKKYSSRLRAWHWSNMVVISGSFLTVLMNSTVTEYIHLSHLIRSGLAAKNMKIDVESALFVAHTITDNIWFIHVYFGYALAGLLILRIVLEFFELTNQKLLRRMKSAYANYKVVKKNRETARHGLAVKLTYIVFYILLLTMVSTGLFVGFGSPFSFYKTIVQVVLKIHEIGMYFILIFIIAHLLGVFFAERKTSKGVVSDMINGGEAVFHLKKPNEIV